MIPSPYMRAGGAPRGSEQLYLDLLKMCLTRYDLEGDVHLAPVQGRRPGTAARLYRALRGALNRYGLELARRNPVDLERRREGRDWPPDAETMIGLLRLENIERCLKTVLRDDVPGDAIETGVWRGGASIFMRGLLAAYGVTDRTVWLADSFQGLPKPDPAYPSDEGTRLWAVEELRVSLDDVRANFEKYGLLDDRVRFLPGWFKDTLPAAPIERLAVLRLDGDLYESTIQALDALYPKLSPGGFAIVDDYGAMRQAKEAIHDFRAEHGIDDELVPIDWSGVYWRRS